MNKSEALKKYFGHSSFRSGQEPIIDALLAGRDAAGIMPTGAGKSICYQLPAVMMDGVTIVISPLISLMKDQVNALNQTGIPAAYLNSSLTERQFRLALSRAYNGAYRIIYIAPERLETEGFLRLAESLHISMITVDEAHCISQWGQDFRPSYLKIREFIDRLSYRPVVSAFTATATANVRNDIIRILRLDDPVIVTTGFDRKNLYFGVEHPPDKMRSLISILKRNSGKSGIVYCATRKNVEEVCASLRQRGFRATRYHAGLEEEEKQKNQDDFLYDRDTVMVATNAFGMGIDKSNVSFVVHFNMPKDIESYYQEAGRAGRDGEEAECILLYSKQDVRLANWMIDNTAPNELLTAEQRSTLKKRDKERLKQMTFYSTTDRCLRQFILNYFGDKSPCECGKCSGCRPEKQIDPRGAARVSSGSSRRAMPMPETPFTETEERLFEALKRLRADEARKAGVPAFVIFTDASLRDMCRRKPLSKSAFMEVSGVGQAKTERYGAAFIAEIRKLTAQGSGVRAGDTRRSSPAGKDRSSVKRPSGQGDIKRELMSGKTLGQIARERGCGIDQIMEIIKGLK